MLPIPTTASSRSRPCVSSRALQGAWVPPDQPLLRLLGALFPVSPHWAQALLLTEVHRLCFRLILSNTEPLQCPWDCLGSLSVGCVVGMRKTPGQVTE